MMAGFERVLDGLIRVGVEDLDRARRDFLVEAGDWDFSRCKEGRMTTKHAFDMVDFMLLARGFSKVLFLEKSIFCYPETRMEVFFKKKNSRKKSLIRLEGHEGASWFDYHIQLTRFLPDKVRIAEISISYRGIKMVVLFVPRVFKKIGGLDCSCSLLTVNTKTGGATWRTTFYSQSTYNPRIVGKHDVEYLF